LIINFCCSDILYLSLSLSNFDSQTRKWKEEHEQALKEIAQKSEARQQRLREKGKQELLQLIEQRNKEIQARKAANREREAAFLKSREAAAKENRVWELVAQLVELSVNESVSTSVSSPRAARAAVSTTAATTTESTDSNSNATNELTTSTSNTTKPTVPKKDTSRMRELLLRLAHTSSM
jgi:hypothetical protein